jgi:putative oxidoreductase
MKDFLFPSVNDDKKLSSLLLVLRVVFGLLLAYHGMQKLIGFSAIAPSFPDPLGTGSTWALALAIFGELFCSVAFIFGFLFRLSTIPMIFTMVVALFTAKQELALAYLLLYVILYIFGPGKYALDTMIARAIHSK